MNLKYLVTGTGRCGTVHVSMFLTSIGIPCGHETIFDWMGLRGAIQRLNGELERGLSIASTMDYNGGNVIRLPAWTDASTIVADSSYMAAPFLKEDILKDTKVIHIVRNPLKVINSFCNYIHYFQSQKPSNSYEQFIYRFLPDLKKNMSPYDRAALYYIQWNEMIESDYFHRIEDDKEKLFKFLGKESQTYFDDDKINTFANSSSEFNIFQLKDKQILSELMGLGEKYGYDMRGQMLF